MDSKSTSCFAWFVLLKEAANKRWERLRETVRHAFSRTTKYLEKNEPCSLGRKAGYSKLVRPNKARHSFKDGYTYSHYLPSPIALSPSEFSIWSAFFPYSTDVVCATPVKPVMPKTHADFSIWRAFFPGSTDVVCATPVKPVMPKTQADFSIWCAFFRECTDVVCATPVKPVMPKTQADFSIWSAFFPYSTEVVCATPVKPVMPKTQADFSIWCAFFPESTNVVCATPVKPVMPKTQADFSSWCAFFPESTNVVCATPVKPVMPKTQADFSIWCAFFQESTDVVCATPVKPVMPKTQADFSIWCAFFQESTAVVCATQVKPVILKTQASASLRSCTIYPKLLPAVPVSLGVMSPSAVVTISPACRTQRPSLITPTACLVCCTVSPYEVAITSAVIPSIRDVTPRSVFTSPARSLFTSPMSPSVAGFTSLMSSVRSISAYGLIVNTSTLISAVRIMFLHAMPPFVAGSSDGFVSHSIVWSDLITVMNEPQSLMPKARSMSVSVVRSSTLESPVQVLASLLFFASGASVIPAKNVNCLYQVLSTASGFVSDLLPRGSESSTQMSNTGRNYILWSKIIQILSLLSKARPLMFSVEQIRPLAMYAATSEVLSTVVPYVVQPLALSFEVGPTLTALISPAVIASVIAESSTNWPEVSTCRVPECGSESALSPESLAAVSVDRQMVLKSSAHECPGAGALQPDHRTAMSLVCRWMPICSAQPLSMLSLSAIQIQHLQLLQLLSHCRMIAESGVREQQTGILSKFPPSASRGFDGFLLGHAMALRAEECRLPPASLDNGNVAATNNPVHQMLAVTKCQRKMTEINPARTSQDYAKFGYEDGIDVISENAITCESRSMPNLQGNIVSVIGSSLGVQCEGKSTLCSLADDEGLPMFSTSEDSVTNNVQEYRATVTTCDTSVVSTSTTGAAGDPQVDTEDDDNFMSTFLGFSPGADFREGVFACREDSLPETSVGQRLRAAARLQRKQEGYDKETFQIFRQNENNYRADPCYMDRQIYISNEMRNTTISWMAEIADYVEMSYTGLFLSVNFFDRFMSECNVTKNNLQLVAVTCMFIAGKIEKGDEAAAADDYVYLTASTYISDQIFGLEKLILKKLQFNLFVPTVAWFCKELLDVCKANDKLEYMTMFLAEMTMLDTSYISVKPSTIAAASLCLARHNLGLPVWTLELWERSCYLPDDILPCVKSIARTCAFYRTTENETQQGILRKYSTEKYQEIANISKFPEKDIDGLEKKCREFGALEFSSPSRNASRRYRYNLFSGRDTPLTYEPNKRRVSFYKPRNKRGLFEGYGVETYKIMRDSENRADPDCMTKQLDISISRRQLEVNWMIHFIELANYPTSSLLLAVNLMDRFLSHRYVKKEMLKLVAVACLFTTTKFEMMCLNTIDVFTAAVRNAYSKQQIIGMEKLILTTLDFNLLVPTAAWFSEELLDVCCADDTLRALTRYLIELTTLEIRYLHYRPSQIAAAALCIARYSLGLPPWTKKLLERSGYELEDFLGCLRSLYDDYKLSEDHQGELQCKFRKPKYMEVADFTKYPVPGIFRLLELYFKEMDQT